MTDDERIAHIRILATEHAQPGLRCQHAKTHGSVVATLAVPADVPTAFQHGVLAQPGNHDALIRFSSSNPVPQPDYKRDARGMAIKVDGTWDLILATGQTFFCKGIPDAEALTQAMRDGKLRSYFLRRPRALLSMMSATGRWPWSRRITNPLHASYYSQIPFAHGQQAVKWSAIPVARRGPSGGRRDDPELLRTALAQHLRQTDAAFDLRVQPQTMADSLDDARDRWRGPWTTVARITIPPQLVQDREDLAFGVADAIGPIAQVRDVVYRDSQQRRGAGRSVP